jgi:hypothetical protein
VGDGDGGNVNKTSRGSTSKGSDGSNRELHCDNIKRLWVF